MNNERGVHTDKTYNHKQTSPGTDSCSLNMEQCQTEKPEGELNSICFQGESAGNGRG